MISSPTREDIERFGDIVARRLGLLFDAAKLDYLADVFVQRLHATGSPRPNAYLEDLCRTAAGAGELRALAERLTVSETYFFRNPDNFRALTDVALASWRTRSRHERRLRILSAGCASGEEPYSIAMAVREQLPDLESSDIEILGIDVNPAVLAKARAARYPEWSLRGTSADARQRYFQRDGRDFLLAGEVRRMVEFKECNLVEPTALLGQTAAWDVIFCRNVLMYFPSTTARAVVQRLTLLLRAHGHLFLGHAETLRGLSQQFHLCHTHNTFYYRLRDAHNGTECVEPPLAATSRADPPPGLERSWVDVIQRASARIALLAQPARPTTEVAACDAHAGVTAPERAWDLGLVLDAVRSERFSDALKQLRALPPDALDDPETLLLHAVVLTHNGAFDESERTCLRLLALDELNAGAHYVMALCREHAGDHRGAVERAQTAVYLDSDFAMPHLHLGLLSKRAGDPATARIELAQALELFEAEDASRLLLFGGGFSREALLGLCRAELSASMGADNERS